MENNDLLQLSEKLGYTFKDIQLLDAALTHRSVKPDNNERLEFLGDSILNFVIAEALYKKCPDATEGELSRMRANLIKGETLAELAIEFDLGHYLRLGVGESKSGGHRRSSILADAVEAIIAAIFLDSGISICRRKVLSWYHSRLNKPFLMKKLKDPKTRLQEHLQAKKFPLPDYTIDDITGEAHEQEFHVHCAVKGIEEITYGSGSSRRRAEQEAAENFLLFLESL